MNTPSDSYMELLRRAELSKPEETPVTFKVPEYSGPPCDTITSTIFGYVTKGVKPLPSPSELEARLEGHYGDAAPYATCHWTDYVKREPEAFPVYGLTPGYDAVVPYAFNPYDGTPGYTVDYSGFSPEAPPSRLRRILWVVLWAFVTGTAWAVIVFSLGVLLGGCYRTVVVDSSTQPVQLAQDVPNVKVRAFAANGDLVETANKVTLKEGQWVVTHTPSTQPVK